MKYSKILITPALALALFSCKKVIEVQETDVIAGSVALKTVANNEALISGAYAVVGTEMDILLNSTLTDEVKPGEFYNAATTHEWQYSSSDITIRDNFSAVVKYNVIDRANRVLQALPAADSTRAGDIVLKSRLKGEALFLRAYTHFQIAQYFTNNYNADSLAMPYMTTPSISSQARIKMGAYYTQLLSDLDTCNALLPATAADNLRANQIAVAGLRARVALYMHKWTDAVTYATQYITAIPLADKTTFAGIWTFPTSGKEAAWVLKRTTSSSFTRIGSLFRATSANATTPGSVTWTPSDKIWAAYDQTNDIRFKIYLKDETLLTGLNRPSHIIAKYAGGGYASTTENLADDIAFRTAEMYLIRAEAKANNNDLQGAADDINTLRTNRINNYTNIAAYASTGAAVTDIIQERFKELAFEGYRFWDLRRDVLPISRLASDAPNTNSTTLPAGNFRFVLPIPIAEMQANRLMVQNPGYAN